MSIAMGRIEGSNFGDLPRREGHGGIVPADEHLEFKPETVQGDSPHIYRVLADHQQSEDWRHRSLVIELHRWADLFNHEFALSVPEFSLSIDRLRCTRLGQFRDGHNGFGLKGEIVINQGHLGDDFWEVLGTLLHELIHGWQQAFGKPGRGNYHNKEFRDKATSYGLAVDHRGVTKYEPESRFFELLERHGIRHPELSQPTATGRVAGRSKLRKWSCGCTNVRVAVPTFSARCLLCDRLFELAGGDG